MISSDTGKGIRRDVNKENVEAFEKCIRDGNEMYFERYGKDRVHLCALATLPISCKRGAEILQIRHAMYLSKLHERRLTVFATAMEKSLYDGLGFWNSGRMIEDAGEEEFEIWCMYW